MSKKTMTLNLTEQEMNVLEELCEQKQMSKTQLVRQALRLYQKMDERIESGGKLYFEDNASKEKSEIMVL
tara:strand:- start:1842 stop:2051 length:210 start_codon:yes stop_codon:yes gene_type:complete